MYSNELFITTKKSIVIFPIKLGITSIPLIGMGNYSQSSKSLPMHIHEHILEIVYVHKGHQVYTMNNTSYELFGGSVFITPPDTLHSTGDYPEDKASFIWMHVDLSNEKDFLGLSKPLSTYLYDSLIHLNIPIFNGTPHLYKLINEIFKLRTYNDNINIVKIQNLIVSFLLEVIDCKNNNKLSGISDDIQKSITEIENTFTQQVDLSMIAKKINLSESRFRQKFKQQVGIPPQEYIWRKRVDKAKEIITTTDLSFSNIALNLGFKTNIYFTRVFKRYTFMTPTQFKQINQTKK